MTRFSNFTHLLQVSDADSRHRTEKKQEKSMVPAGAHEIELADRICQAGVAHPGLNVKPAAMRCIANFGAIQSRLEEKSTVASNAINAWARLGCVDHETKSAPDPDATLANATRAAITQAQVAEFWSDCCPDLVREFTKLGRTPEDAWKACVLVFMCSTSLRWIARAAHALLVMIMRHGSK